MIDSKTVKPNGQVEWDTGERESVKGLHIRWRAGGNASFLYAFRDSMGKQRRRKLGDVSGPLVITIREARRLARSTPEMIGGEKIEDKAGPRSPTIGELYAVTLEKHWSAERFVLSDRKKGVVTVWNRIIKPQFENLPFDRLTIGMIQTLKDANSHRIYEFNRGKEILGVVFKDAARRELIPMSYQNPCSFVPDYVEKKRKIYPTIEEMRAIEERLKYYEPMSPRGVAFVRLMALTGSRPRALERARMDEMQIFVKNGVRSGVITFDGKGTADHGEQEQLFLTPEALAVVESLPPSPDGRMLGCENPVRLWRKIRKDIGNEKLWLRDLRRSYATVGLSIAGLGKDAIGGLLNHRSVQTTNRYAMYMQDSKMNDANKIGEAIKTIMNGI